MSSFAVLRILFFSCLGHFCVDFMVGIWPIFKTIAHVDLLVAGLIAGSSAFISEGFQVVFGTLADRGYQRILFSGSFILAALSCFFPYVDSNLSFLFLYLGTLMGSSAFHPTAGALLGGLKVSNRNTVMGLFSAFGMCGLGISHICFSWSLQNLNGQTYILAVPALVLALLAVISLPNAPLQQRERFSLKPILSCFKNRPLRGLFIALVGNQIVFWSLVFLLPDLLLARGYDTWIVFGVGHLALMAGAALAPPFFGYLADRTSVRSVMVVVTSSYLVFYYLLLLPVKSSEMWLLAHLFVLGAFLASFSPLAWSMGNQLVPNNRGIVSAFLMGFVWMVSESLGVGASGVVASFFSSDGAAKSLACMGVATAVTLYYSFKVSEESPEMVISKS